MPEITLLGWIHTIIAIIALIAGFLHFGDLQSDYSRAKNGSTLFDLYPYRGGDRPDDIQT